ncbi:dihydroxyacetone kinase subunit DhaK [Cryobacterium gelidum]|uniref:Dihydroxyacetone kinase subunit DhaK n=1 Tax=Cryobacterium gelidum TaxID=1259164 RepID=A0A4V3IUL8_9MICO|nr:dihydroxyacetone kinase subunit DhaK [Cryobacterium gelidum]TFD73606.1 dihydroxyacetone kinase subunit DhaK [Cryobacterium gelidum]
MKKFLNDPAHAVTDYLVGLAAAHPTIVKFDAAHRIIVRAADPRTGKVGLIAGGGSGCEPLHTGFVGHGMLDAACPGEIFTSPVPKQIVAATRAADQGSGVLHVIKNFSGEVMNFGMATELLAFEGIAIDSVLIDDDVSIPDMPGTAGRRGLGATVLVEKIAGAAAERGDDLASVTCIARRVNARTRTFGVGLSSCTPPLRGKPIYDLPDDEIEIGIGISGEPGRERVAMRNVQEIARTMIAEVLADLRPTPGAALLVMVNGMGATPLSELYVLYGECDQALRSAGLNPVRSLVGNYVTSLDQAGAALTILELDDEMTVLWDAPVRTSSITWGALA